MHPRLEVIEEHQLLDAVACVKLHLLGGGDSDVGVVALLFLHQESTRFLIGEDDLPQGIGLEIAQQLAIPPNGKGDVGQNCHSGSVIFDDFEAGQLLVGKGRCGHFTRHHGDGLDGLCIRDPALDSGGFAHLVSTRFQLIEDGDAPRSGLGGLGSAAFNVLDLYGDALQALAGVAVLLHPQRPVGVVVKGHLGLFSFHYSDILGGVFAEQVKFRSGPLVNGIISGLRLGDDDGSAPIGGKDADGVSVGAHHLKNRPGQRNLGARLQLYDPQGAGTGRGGVRRIGDVGGIGHIRAAGVGADGVDADGRGGVGCGHVSL